MSAVEQIPATTAQNERILSVNNIEVIYDHVILVLKGVSLDVPKGGIVALLGANGAGKTTTLKAISNLLHAERGDVTKGSIVFEGAEVQDLSPNELVRRGCIQVMEVLHTGQRRGDIVASVTRPGGNITGVFLDFPDFGKKCHERRCFLGSDIWPGAAEGSRSGSA